MASYTDGGGADGLTGADVQAAGMNWAPRAVDPSAVTRLNTGTTGGLLRSNASGGPAVSADGHYAVYSGTSASEAGVFLKDLQTGTVRSLAASVKNTPPGNGAPYSTYATDYRDPTISADGRYAAYVTYDYGIYSYYGYARNASICVQDLQTGVVTTIATQGNNVWDVQLSGDGRYLLFGSNTAGHGGSGPSTLTHMDLQAGVKTTVGDQSHIPGSYSPVMSRDGRFVASARYVLDGSGFSVFLQDMQTGAQTRVATVGNASIAPLAFSADDGRLLLTSASDALVADDTNGHSDLFVYSLGTGATTRVSTAYDGGQGDGNSLAGLFTADGNELNADVTSVSVSADGTRLLFATSASNVVDGDTNGETDLFVATLEPSSGGNAGAAPETTPPPAHTAALPPQDTTPPPTPPTTPPDTTTPPMDTPTSPPVDTRPSADMQRVVDGVTETVKAYGYEGPVSTLKWTFLGDGRGEVLGGSADNDFINLLGGDDAANGGAGNDVLDGGAGSNWLIGGAGNDTFFVDGRNGQPTWSTVTDLEKGEWATLWGYKPGASKLTWEEAGGADGYKGATAHVDIDGNGTIDASMTFTGKAVGAMTVTTGTQGDQTYIAFINV